MTDNTNGWVIGLLGGIASGKSTVADMWASFGARVIDADEMAAELLKDPSIQEKLAEAFGDRVLDNDSVDRAVLGELVFSSSEHLETLNEIMHPPILQAVQKEIKAFRSSGNTEKHKGDPSPYLVLDVPLLVEYDFHEQCDVLLYLEASRETRLRRVKEERGWTEEELDRREDAQADLDLKRENADFIITTDKNRKITKRELERIRNELDQHSE